MKNIFKQSGELATASNKSNFTRAVLLLTVYYTVGAFLILAVFNVIVYALFASSIRSEEFELSEHYPFEEERGELEEAHIEKLQDDLAGILLTSDAIIMILALIVSYTLSRRTLMPLEDAYRKQERFIADAAHELRTPLSAMQAGSEVILRSDRTTGEYTQFLKENLEEVKRLTTLSNDLLFLARNNRPNAGLVSRVHLSELCQKRINAMQAYANTKGISIKGDIEDGLYVMGAGDDMVRLLDNLLKNSIDYNRPNGSVTLLLQKKSGGIRLSVKDTGIGIGKNELPHIFERFYKASASRTQNASGTGLGLAMVKEIVEAHSGSVTVQSTVGEGTVFEVILPAV